MANNDIPETLRMFRTLGLDFSIKGKEAVSTCPFCNREGKFSISIEKGLCRCFSCEAGSDKGGMNQLRFLREFQDLCYEMTEDYSELQEMKGFLEPETLAAWTVSKNVLNNRWQVPAYSARGDLTQLYQYVKLDKGYTMIPLPGLSHQMFGEVDKAEKVIVYLFEGPWDAMTFWEVARRTKDEEGTYSETDNEEESILTDAAVVAMPGTGSFGEPFEKFLPFFSGKLTVLGFDSDYPKKNQSNGKETEPAGFRATKKAIEMLSGSDLPADEIEYIHWGDRGYDPDLPSGFDVRDALSRGDVYDLEGRIENLGLLMEKIRTVPDDWKSEPGSLTMNSDLQPIECRTYEEMIEAWEEALSWTPGLDYALSTMLASIVSTNSAGDQLWVKIIGPASCGKSTLCEAVSIARKHVIARSTIRGFFSGYKTDKDGDEDHSLAVKARNKTLVTKDGDTLLQAPELPRILSEARDLYDRTSRTDYRTGINREYKDMNMTWILCGTSSLKSIDSSELGERFLDCVIMDEIDDDLEEIISWNKANRALEEIGIEATGDNGGSGIDPLMTEAKQKTGGYIEHITGTFQEKVRLVKFPKPMLRKCTRLGKLVSCMRARPSVRQAETVERELSARLVSQIVRLSICTAVVLNKEKVDSDVMNRTIKIAMDTSRGPTLDLADYLHSMGREGSSVNLICNGTGMKETAVRDFLRFLRKLKVVEAFVKKEAHKVSKPLWRLTESFNKLYDSVEYE